MSAGRHGLCKHRGRGRRVQLTNLDRGPPSSVPSQAKHNKTSPRGLVCDWKFDLGVWWSDPQTTLWSLELRFQLGNSFVSVPLRKSPNPYLDLTGLQPSLPAHRCLRAFHMHPAASPHLTAVLGLPPPNHAGAPLFQHPVDQHPVKQSDSKHCVKSSNAPEPRSTENQ